MGGKLSRDGVRTMSEIPHKPANEQRNQSNKVYRVSSQVVLFLQTGGSYLVGQEVATLWSERLLSPLTEDTNLLELEVGMFWLGDWYSGKPVNKRTEGR